jgi:hypothetical protein
VPFNLLIIYLGVVKTTNKNNFSLPMTDDLWVLRRSLGTKVFSWFDFEKWLTLNQN